MIKNVAVKSIRGAYGYKYGAGIPYFISDFVQLKSGSNYNIDDLRKSWNEKREKHDSLYKQRVLFSEEKVLNDLKQDLLIFDKLYIEEQGAYCGSSRICEEFDKLNKLGAIEYIDQEDLNNVTREENDKILTITHSFKNITAANLWSWIQKAERTINDYEHCLYLIIKGASEFYTEDENNWNEKNNRFERLKNVGFDKAYKEYISYSQFVWDIYSRMNALLIADKLDCEVTPVISSETSFWIMQKTESLPQDIHLLNKNKLEGSIAHLILNNIPMPCKDNPLEKILDFRADDNARLALFRLRRWLKSAIKCGDSLKDINEEVQYRLLEYEQHMKHYRLKTSLGGFETLVVTSIEVIENIAKFKISKAAKSIFKIYNRQIELVEEEMKAPGREVAYISKIKEKI